MSIHSNGVSVWKRCPTRTSRSFRSSTANAVKTRFGSAICFHPWAAAGASVVRPSSGTIVRLVQCNTARQSFARSMSKVRRNLSSSKPPAGMCRCVIVQRHPVIGILGTPRGVAAVASMQTLGVDERQDVGNPAGVAIGAGAGNYYPNRRFRFPEVDRAPMTEESIRRAFGWPA
jgi:hypothetical protein